MGDGQRDSVEVTRKTSRPAYLNPISNLSKRFHTPVLLICVPYYITGTDVIIYYYSDFASLTSLMLCKRLHMGGLDQGQDDQPIQNLHYCSD